MKQKMVIFYNIFPSSLTMATNQCQPVDNEPADRGIVQLNC